jgi:hypothetical protein
MTQWTSENDLHPTEGNDAYEAVHEQIQRVQEELPTFSTCFPESLFVYIEVECFGGICIHSGYHVQNGQILTSFEAGKEEVDIAEILAPLGVRLNATRYFKPFTRGYFERDKLQHWGRTALPPTASADAIKVDPQVNSRPWWKFWQH